jgi:hypothetical protein
MPPQAPLLSQRQRSQPLALRQPVAAEALGRHWPLGEGAHQASARYRQGFRFSMALPICAVRVYGRFLNHVHDVSPHRRTYLGPPLALPPSCTVEAPEREATVLEHRQHVLKHWGVQRFDPLAPAQLEPWMAQQARRGALPAALCQQAEPQVGAQRVLRPGPSGLARLIMHGWSNVHDERFATVCKRLSPALRQASAPLLRVPDGAQHSGLAHLKADPPAPSMASIPASLQRSHTVAETGMAAGALPFKCRLFSYATLGSGG